MALAVLWRHYTELKSWSLSFVQVLLSLAAGLLVLWVNLDAGWMLMGKRGKSYNPT